MTINVSTGFEFLPASLRGGERREHGGVQVGVPPHHQLPQAVAVKSIDMERLRGFF